jgi:hypothetical protein
MIKPIFGKSKWLASVIILGITFLPFASCLATNQLPVISSLTADYEGEINTADSCQITCIASDPDGDELTYTWTAYGGTISGEGPTVTWTAPDMYGTCTIKVEVSDGRNGLATELINIEVTVPNSPPIIENLTTDCPRVKPGGTATIECIASDPDGDELTYTWTADRGNINWEGNIATWVAPSDYGNYTITVTVTDGRGGEATSSWITNSQHEGLIIVCGCGSACS